jgi:hypothetical protein
MRVIAIDWSGAVLGGAKHIWLAEASDAARLDRLVGGWTRAALAESLLETIVSHPRVAIGLDFAFSMPAWYLARLGLQSAPELWAHVAEHGERWLAECAPPFWGRRPGPRPTLDGAAFRRTELEVPAQAGIRPKSVFQIGGAGAVGTGSIRGMPLLHSLRAAGAHIWPFDPPGWPLVLEIYPRLLTGPVTKSNAAARAQHLAQFDALSATHRELGIGSEDAFDAAVSALAMQRHAAEIASLSAESDATLRLEGRIWHPAVTRVTADTPRSASL